MSSDAPAPTHSVLLFLSVSTASARQTRHGCWGKMPAYPASSITCATPARSLRQFSVTPPPPIQNFPVPPPPPLPCPPRLLAADLTRNILFRSPLWLSRSSSPFYGCSNDVVMSPDLTHSFTEVTLCSRSALPLSLYLHRPLTTCYDHDYVMTPNE